MAERSLNKVQLLGRLGRDPEVRYTNNGQAVANFSMATSESWRSKDGNDETRTEWHKVVAFGKLGEICGQYLNKGKQVFIEGRLQTREWQDRDGNKRTTTEIVVSDMIMLGGRGDGGGSGGGGGSRGSQSGSDQGGGPPPNNYDQSPPDDDIPF